MDTGSHILCGLSIGGLAYFDPVVASHPQLAHAVIIGSVLGANVPDLDALTRFLGYTVYIRNHRGVAHSVPFAILWPTLIAFVLCSMDGLFSMYAHVWIWSFLAVVSHLMLDALNTYGVQCLRPFTQKWIALDVLTIFDPTLFGIQLTAVMMWVIQARNPGIEFLIAYLMCAVYIVIRIRSHRRAVQLVASKLDIEKIVALHVMPTLKWNHWAFVGESESAFCTGSLQKNELMGVEVYQKQTKNPIIEATMKTDGVRAFIHFAQRVYVSCKELHDGYEVSWRDMRFSYQKNLPFGVDVELDAELNVKNEVVGWRKKVWEPPFV